MMGYNHGIKEYKSAKKLRDWFMNNRDGILKHEVLESNDNLMPESVFNEGLSVINAFLSRCSERTMLVHDDANYNENDDIHFVCFNCGCEIQNSNWSDGEKCTIEWNFCPQCGYSFTNEENVSHFDGTVMKCENCGHCRTEGYEYPETYCELGIDDDHKRSTADGCSLTKHERIKLCREIKDKSNPDWFSLWWDESKETGDI